MPPRIGFIGLDVMGKAMAARLLDASYTVAVHNRSQGAVHELAERGARACLSPQEVAACSDVVITLLSDIPDADLVFLGEHGVLAGAVPGSVVIDMTTTHPETSARLATQLQAKQVAMLDAPVSGDDVSARHGTLSIMVGGPRPTFAACEPILKVLGHKIVHIGPHVGMGGHAKLANQILVAITLAGMGEALVYGAKAGIDPALLVEAMSAGQARCGALDIKAPKVLAGDFKPGSKVDAQVKDLHDIMQTARNLKVVLPVTAVVNELFHAVQYAGRGEWDHAAIITVLEDFARITVRSPRH